MKLTLIKKMAILLLALGSLALSGCGTIGGALSGAGTDLTSAGDWVKGIGALTQKSMTPEVVREGGVVDS